MAQIVKLRRSSISGQKPTNSNLQLGELALNTSDGKIFMAVSGALSATVEEAIVTNTSNTGSINLSGSIRLNGTETVTGSVLVNGLLQVTGDTSLTSLVISGSDSVANVQAFVPSSSVYNNAGFNTPDRVASGIRFNWSNENWTIGAARGLTTDVDGLVFSRNGERNLLLHESGDMYLTGALRVTGSLFLNGQVVGTGKLNETDFNNYTSSVSSQFAGTSSFALTASHALNAVVLDGQTKTQNFSTPSTTWSFNHQMGVRYPSITIFDSDGYVVIPSEIHAIDDNNLNVYFPSNQTGLVSVTVGGAGTAGTSGTSGISGTSGTSGVNGTNGTSGTSGVNGTSGTSGTSGRDGIGGKSETFASSTTWSVFHNLDERYPVVNVWNDVGRMIIPSEIVSIDNNNLEVRFSSAQSGSVNIVKGGHLVSGAVDLSTALNGSGIVSSSVQGTNLGFATTGSNTFIGNQTFSGSLIPVGSGSYDLGSQTNPFRHLYLSSASLYIDGQKVLGSTNQELQITTDNGQSIKILEQGTDTITLQTTDGDIQLKSSGGGNILIDPTTGSVDIRGNIIVQDGFKILSSGGNSVVFGDDVIVSGSANFTNGITIGGVSYASATSGTSGTSGSSGSSGTAGTSGSSGSSGTSGTSVTVTGTNNTIGKFENGTLINTNIIDDGSLVNINSNATITGSLTITQNLNVLGSSSITFTTASQLRVSDNIITVNASSPGVRFAGLSVLDSGSSPLVSGSFLFDSLNNQFIYVHTNQATVTSSVVMVGAQTYNSLGNEILPTTNRVLKSLGQEHLGDSNISDDGTNVRINGSLIVTGSILSTITPLVSGSSQIVYSGLTGIPSGIVSGSSQITLSATTGYGSVLNQAVLTSSSPTFAGATVTGTITSNVTNAYGLALNRATVTNYNGISLQTAGVAQWYVGMRENLSSNNYVIYNESGTDALTISKSNNNVTFAGTITENSSLRYKENVETIKYGLDKVLQMRGVTYDKKDNGVKEMGVIAEEVYELLPEVVLKNEEGEIDSVSYGRITAVLIEAIKDLKKEIEDLKANR
jgi:collagen type VII alpha